MMLTQSPDPGIHEWELESALNIIRKNLQKGKNWQFREEYIDRGILDPYYILKIREPRRDKEDDLWEQKVWQGENPGFSYVHRTTHSSKNYWCDISTRALIEQLNGFKEDYDQNRFQPAGFKGDLFEPRQPHKVFEERRFVYELLTPFKNLTGIGPSMYALGRGAVCGTVIGSDGVPMDDVKVQLQMGDEKLVRTSGKGGLFWFSKVQPGTYKVTVDEQPCTLQVIRRDEFGNIEGWVTDQDGYPVEYADIQFKAPDGSSFPATSDETGKFVTGPLPAYPVVDSPLSNYPYIMEIPEFMFSISKSIEVKNAVVGGVLQSAEGKVLAGKEVILKSGSEEVGRTDTDAHGNFQFYGLSAGMYQLEVPEEQIYLSRLSAGKVRGTLQEGRPDQTLVELIVNGESVATERISRDKHYAFNKVPPGTYSISDRKRNVDHLKAIFTEQDGRLVDRLVELLDGAEEGSYVRFNVFLFHYDDQEHELIEALINAAKRSVHIQLIVDQSENSEKAANQIKFRQDISKKLEQIANEKSWIKRHKQVIHNGLSSKDHNKFFLFSDSLGEKNWVIISSENLTDNGAGKHQSSVEFRDDYLYNQFLDYSNQILKGSFSRFIKTRFSGPLRAYFFPKSDTTDILHSFLKNLEPGTGSIIRVFMSRWTKSRMNIVDKLLEHSKKETKVKVIIRANYPRGKWKNVVDKEVIDKLEGESRINMNVVTETSVHSKYILLEGMYGKYVKSKRKIVFMGSHNFTGRALRNNYESWIRIADNEIYKQFSANFEELYLEAK